MRDKEGARNEQLGEDSVRERRRSAEKSPGRGREKKKKSKAAKGK